MSSLLSGSWWRPPASTPAGPLSVCQQAGPGTARAVKTGHVWTLQSFNSLVPSWEPFNFTEVKLARKTIRESERSRRGGGGGHVSPPEKTIFYFANLTPRTENSLSTHQSQSSQLRGGGHYNCVVQSSQRLIIRKQHYTSRYCLQ